MASVSNVRVSYLIGTLLYLQLQKWDSKNKTLTRFLDRLGTRWQRLSAKVAAGALAHARHHQGGAHLLRPHPCRLRRRDEQHGIDYFNCGAWIDAHPTYITVGEDGVQIHEYVEPPERSSFHRRRSRADAEARRNSEGEVGLLNCLTANSNSTPANTRVWLPDSLLRPGKFQALTGGHVW
jgi:hypothetical protein